MSKNHISRMYTDLMREINQTRILDTIPLDYFLHIAFGQAIYLICRLFKLAPIKALIIVIVVELIKEIADSFAMTHTLTESLIDFVLTISLPTACFVIGKMTGKKKLN